MKIATGFMLRQIAGQWMVVPTGARVVEFGNMITLNESAAFLWKRLEHECTQEELVQALLGSFEEVTLETARADVDAFLQKARENGLLNE